MTILKRQDFLCALEKKKLRKTQEVAKNIYQALGLRGNYSGDMIFNGGESSS